MKEKMSSDLFHDDAPTGVISKEPLDTLHYGDYETPLTALGLQKVVVSSPMGKDHPDWTPVTSKGPTVDQSKHGGEKSEPYKETSSSVKNSK